MRRWFTTLPDWVWPFAVALVARLVAIDLRPLWYDEAFGVLLARRGWEAIATATWRALVQGQRAEHHTPLFYLLQHAWMQVFGQSVLATRLLPVVLSLGAWWAAWRLAHRWLPRGEARMAMWAFSLSPFLVHYSQEARMYSLLLLTALCLLWFFQLAVEQNRALWWAATGLSGLLMLYTHNAAVLYLAAWGLPGLYLAWRRGRLRPLLLTALAVAVGYLPWLWVLLVQVVHVRQAYWIPRPGLPQLVNTLLAFTVHVPLPGATAIVGLFITLWLLALGVEGGLRFPHVRTQVRPLLVLLLLPWLAIGLFSLWLPVYLVRLLLPLAPLYLFALIRSLNLPERPGFLRGTLLLTAVAALGVGYGVHWTYTGFPYAPYEDLGEWLLARIEPGDLVLHANKLSYLPMVYTTPQLPQAYLPDPPGSGSDTLSPAMRRGLGIPDPVALEEALQAPRVWLLIFEREIEEYRRVQGEHPALARFQQAFCLQSRQAWGALQVYAFQACPEDGRSLQAPSSP